MSCCSASRSKHSYLIHLVDDETGRWGRCVIQSACEHGMQEWAHHLASQDELYVVDSNNDTFLMAHPRVIHVDDKTAAHLPVADPTDCGHCA